MSDSSWGNRSGGSTGSGAGIAEKRASVTESANDRAKRILIGETGMKREIESVRVQADKHGEGTYIVTLKDMLTSEPPVPASQEFQRWAVEDLKLPEDKVDRADTEGAKRVLVDKKALETAIPEIKPRVREIRA